jgi:hypothetical protein
LALLKSRSLNVIRRILGIKKFKSLETSHDIVRHLVDDFQRIGNKSRSKDHNAARRIFPQSIVSKIIRKHHFLQQTSHLMKCNVKTLRKYYHRRDSLDIGGPIDLQVFTGRLPRYNMKLIGGVKGLVQDF